MEEIKEKTKPIEELRNWLLEGHNEGEKQTLEVMISDRIFLVVKKLHD